MVSKVRWRIFVTFAAFEHSPDLVPSAHFRQYPFAFCQRWVVPHMPIMPALQPGTPVALVVLIKTDYLLLHKYDHGEQPS